MTKLEQEAYDFADATIASHPFHQPNIIREAISLGYVQGSRDAIINYSPLLQRQSDGTITNLDLQTFKRQVMAALDKESQLALDAFKLRQELHAELDAKQATEINTWIDAVVTRDAKAQVPG